MKNLICKTNISSYDVEYINENNENELLFDLGIKRIGTVSLTLSHLFNIRNCENVKFRYGPFKDFTVATGCFEVAMCEHEVTLTYELPIAFRYIKIEIPKEFGEYETDFNIVEFEFISVEKRINRQGSFKCSDTLLNDIWEVGAKTIQLCMFPNSGTYAFRFVQPKDRIDYIENWRGEGDNYVLVDGCRRDREVWVGDLLPEIRTCLYVYNDKEIVRNSLQIFADQQKENGFICASSFSAQDYLEYCCWFIICLWEYYFLSGDLDFLKKQEDCLSKLLGYIETKRNSENLITLNKGQTWAWTLARKGCITSSNCVQSMSIECAALCFAALNRSEDSEKLTKLANDIKISIRNKAFDEQNGCFRDVADGAYPFYSLDANSLAVLFDIADEKQKKRSLDFIKDKLYNPYGSRNIFPLEPQTESNWPHNTEIWPFSVGFELDARFSQNDDVNALELLKRCWGNMVLRKTQTYWEIVDGKTGDFMKRAIFHHENEAVDSWNSYCHGWSAGVSYSLSAYVAGIRPIKAGFKDFLFDPHPCGLSFVEATIPAGDDYISISYNLQENESYEAFLDIPEGLVAHHRGVLYESGKHLIVFS